MTTAGACRSRTKKQLTQTVPAPQRGRSPVRAGQVPGEDHGVQAVEGVVGRTDGVLVIVEGGDRRHGAEHLLAADARGRRGVLHHLVPRVPGHQGLPGGYEAIGELGVDAALDVQPRSGQADLARVAEDGADRPGDGTLELGVIEHDVGALAAQFQADRDQVGRSRAGGGLAGARLPGEGDPVHPGRGRR